eukprot:scaffold2707_cov417-Prasinococcus_capsulatus_cf.AAC.33
MYRAPHRWPQQRHRPWIPLPGLRGRAERPQLSVSRAWLLIELSPGDGRWLAVRGCSRQRERPGGR